MQAPGQRADGPAAGVGQARLRHALFGYRAGTDQSVLGLKEDVHAGRYVIRDERRNADAEIHEHAVAQLQRDALGNDGLRVHGHSGNEVIDERRGRHHVVRRDDADRHDMLASTMTVFAAMAITGLKLRAVSA